MATFTPVANTNNFSPTGLVCVQEQYGTGFQSVGPDQQINVGDILYQSNDSTYGQIALPAVVSTAGVGSSAAGALKALQASIHANLLGVSNGYRSVTDTGYGTSRDRISYTSEGLVKITVQTTDTNYSLATGIGQLWGQAGTTAGGGSSYTATAVMGQVASVAGSDYAIGRQAYPKAAYDQFVIIRIQSLAESGVQEISTNTVS